MKNQANMTPTQETNKAPVDNHNEMEICELLDKELKIIILKKLNELQENTNRQTKSGKQYKNKKNFTKEIETIRKEPKRNPVAEEYNYWAENSIKSFNSKLDKQKKVRELKEKLFEIMQLEEQKEKKQYENSEEVLEELYNTMKRTDTHTIEVLGEKGAESLSKDIMAETSQI